MAQENIGTDEAARWKQKYLDSLEVQEQEERALLDRIDMLKRGLVSVSLAGDGLDPDLDRELTGLRGVLRQQGAEERLPALLEQLEQSVLRLDQQKQQSAETVQASLLAVIAQVRRFKLEGSLQRQFRQFEKRLQTQARDRQEGARLLGDFSSLLNEALKAIFFELDGMEKPGFWASLLGASKPSPVQSGSEAEVAAEEQTLERSGSDSAKDVESFEPPDVSENVSSPDKAEDAGGDELSGRLRHALLKLLDNLFIPEQAVKQAAELREALDQEPALADYPGLLDGMTEILIMAMDKERYEFQTFLNSVNDRLEVVQNFINFSRTDREEALADSAELDKSVRQQVGRISYCIAEENDLDSLKKNVQSQLDNILAAMDEFKEKEDKRSHSLADELRNLVDRIDSMERESKQYRAKLEEQQLKAMRDPLTSLPNRAAYELRLQEEYENWRYTGKNLTLVVADVDFFKKVNDTYGHLAGDKVLKVLGRELSKRVRKGDFVSRFGGEEFIVLMPDTSGENATKVMDQIRETLAQCPFHFKEQRVQVTMSFGIAEFTGDLNPDQVFEKADQALYQAKENGRNQCCLAES